MVTQGRVPTQLDEEGLPGGSGAHRQGRSGPLEDHPPELASIELEMVDRKITGSGPQLREATLGGVCGRHDGPHSSATQLTEDGFPAADHAARSRCDGQVDEDTLQAGGPNALGQALDARPTAQGSGEAARALQELGETVGMRMEPGASAALPRARVRAHHSTGVREEAEQLGRRSPAAAGDAASNRRHVVFILLGAARPPPRWWERPAREAGRWVARLRSPLPARRRALPR